MPQANLLGWVQVKEKSAKVKKLNKSNLTKLRREPEHWAYRFVVDFPEGLMTPAGPVGPFRAGDLVSRNAISLETWVVLIHHNAVEPCHIRP